MYFAVYAARARGDFRLLKVTTRDEAGQIADAAINRKTITDVIAIDVEAARLMFGAAFRKLTRSQVALLEQEEMFEF